MDKKQAEDIGQWSVLRRPHGVLVSYIHVSHSPLYTYILTYEQKYTYKYVINVSVNKGVRNVQNRDETSENF